jgi:transcriptional regulator with GAF, ATPase, and Fis domain
LAEIPNNDYALDRINRYENYFYYWQGRYDKVIECYEKYTSEIMKFPEGIFPLLSISITGYAYAQTGLFSQAVGMLDALCKHTRKIGDQYVEASAILALGSAFLDIGKVEEAVEYLNSGLALAVKDKNSWVEMAISLPLSYCFYMAGDIPRSITHFRKYEDLSKRTQITLFPQPYLLEICLLFEKNDDLPNGTAFSLKKEIHKVLSAKNVFLQGIATRCQALMERNKTGDHSQIVKLLNRSIELLRKSGSKIEIAKTQLELARQYLYSGKDKLASKTLSSASKVLSPLNEALIPDDLKHLSAGHYYGENSLKEIFKLGKKIVDIRKSKELGSQLLVSVNRITGAERGALFLQKNSQLELKSSQNITSDQIFGPQFATSLILIKEVVQSGKACIKKQKIKKRTSTFMSEEARSIICVPLILRGQVMGVLYHDSRIFDRTFTESDFELLDYFAGLAAIALDNVLSYEEIQIEKQKLEEKNKYLEEELFMNITSSNDIIGESIPIKQILQRIHQVARTDANALILGATGTGKELVAKAIHQNSLRKEKPFICVQCSALPEQLLASEMFGHEKGAFTGASKRRIGRFELADGGTIFLDEIGDLQPETQVQLLRVLETKKFERIGGNQTIHSDFRLIAATNRDLEEEARKGRFRMDLYYRLNVFPIIIPELRERKEDIPLLTDYFIKLYSKKHGKKFDDIPPGEMKKVMDYDWPGNVRELEHTIERAIILGTGPCLNISILITLSKDPRNFPDQQLTLLDNERQHILNALLKTNWKVRGKGGAAELLDINSSTLFFRMKKLGIKRPDSIRLL